MPVRDANPAIARLFQKYNLVLQGSTKKAAYASGLAGEPLIPVQAITAWVFATSGLVGIGFFLAGQFRMAALVPVIASWGWRGCSEWLRADHRGSSRISAYQWMAIFAVAYLGIFLSRLPMPLAVAPDLASAFGQLFSASMILALQILWAALFLYYGRSRVTASTVSFHVVAGNI
jgi:hypothetical protein